jgi:hypothetical protein
VVHQRPLVEEDLRLDRCRRHGQPDPGAVSAHGGVPDVHALIRERPADRTIAVFEDGGNAAVGISPVVREGKRAAILPVGQSKPT